MLENTDNPSQAKPDVEISSAESALIPTVEPVSAETQVLSCSDVVIDALVAAVPSEQQDEMSKLYEDVRQNISLPFCLESDSRIFKENKDGSRTPLSGLIGRAAVSIDPSRGSTMTVSFARIDAKIGRATFPYDHLSSDKPKAIGILRNSGCVIFSRTGDVAAYLRALNVSVQESVNAAHGWHRSGLKAFGLADQTTVVADAGPKATVAEAASHVHDAVGLEQWKEGVAAKFSGNPLALFSCA